MNKIPVAVKILKDDAYDTGEKAGTILTVAGVIPDEVAVVRSCGEGLWRIPRDASDEIRMIYSKQKDPIRNDKDPMEYLLFNTLGEEARAMKDGANKYGKCDWRTNDTKASTQIAGIMRHLVKYAEGEDIDKDSGVMHLAHIKARCAILMDAAREDCLVDDRLTEDTD